MLLDRESFDDGWRMQCPFAVALPRRARGEVWVVVGRRSAPQSAVVFLTKHIIRRPEASPLRTQLAQADRVNGKTRCSDFISQVSSAHAADHQNQLALPYNVHRFTITDRKVRWKGKSPREWQKNTSGFTRGAHSGSSMKKQKRRENAALQNRGLLWSAALFRRFVFLRIETRHFGKSPLLR